MINMCVCVIMFVLGFCAYAESGSSLDGLQQMVASNAISSKLTEDRLNQIEYNINQILKSQEFIRIYNAEEYVSKGHGSKRSTHTHVAFRASTLHDKCYSHNEVIQFDKNDFLSGPGSPPTDGFYVVPATGMYVFAWSISVAKSMAALTTHLKLNGRSIGALTSDPDRGSSSEILPTASAARAQRQVTTGSGTHPSLAFIMTQANAGDHVTVTAWNVTRGNCPVDGNRRVSSTFSGWLLF